MISLHKTRPILAGVVAVTALVPLGLIGSTSSASAASSGSAAPATTCDLRPRGTIVGAKTKTVDFDIPSASAWTFELPELDLYVYDTTVDGDGSFAQIGPKSFQNSDAGAHSGTVLRTRRSDGGQDSCTATWRLMRGTRLQNVKVTKIKYGRKLTGNLQRVVWGAKPAQRWTSFAKAQINVQFVNARGKWQDAGSVNTGKGGKFTFTKQIGARQWRLYFQGDNLSGVSPYVEIKG